MGNKKYRLSRQLDFQTVAAMIGFEKADKLAKNRRGSIWFDNHNIEVVFDLQNDLFKFYDYDTVEKNGEINFNE